MQSPPETSIEHNVIPNKKRSRDSKIQVSKPPIEHHVRTDGLRDYYKNTLILITYHRNKIRERRTIFMVLAVNNSKDFNTFRYTLIHCANRSFVFYCIFLGLLGVDHHLANAQVSSIVNQKVTALQHLG